jgi:hypothetical protein
MRHERPQIGSSARLAVGAGLAFVIAVAADLLLRVLGTALLGVPDRLSVLSFTSIILTTAVAAVAATVALVVLVRSAARPILAFHRLAAAVAVLSLVGPLAAAVGLAPGSPAIGLGTVITLMLMNVVTTVVLVVILGMVPRPHGTARRPRTPRAPSGR